MAFTNIKVEGDQLGSTTWNNSSVKKALFAGCFALLFIPMLLRSTSDLAKVAQALQSIEEVIKLPSGPRILLYMTTHMSDHHADHLLGCWPYSIANSKLVRMADVTVFMNGPEKRQNLDAFMVRHVFRDKNITIHHSTNLGYQNGAISAMAEGDKQGWFQGYDWVIRLNADVIIRDDAYLLSIMLGNEDVAGIFVDCWGICNQAKHCTNTGYLIHSDFTVFRPSAIPRDTTWNESNDANGEGHAEAMNRITFAHVVQEKWDRWLPGAHNAQRGICRLSDRADSPVAHFNEFNEGETGTQRCINWYTERNMTNEIV